MTNPLEDLSKIVNDLDLEFLSGLGHFLSFQKTPIKTTCTQIIDSGAVQYFVQYLDPTYIEQYCQIRKTNNEPTYPSKMNVITMQQLYALQYEVTWCITNVVGGTSDHTKYMVEMGCVPLLINLLTSDDCELRRHSARAIANIAGDSPVMRDYVNEMGVMKHLLKLVEIKPCQP